MIRILLAIINYGRTSAVRLRVSPRCRQRPPFRHPLQLPDERDHFWRLRRRPLLQGVFRALRGALPVLRSGRERPAGGEGAMRNGAQFGGPRLVLGLQVGAPKYLK